MRVSHTEEHKNDAIKAQEVIDTLRLCFEKDNDFALFIENLSALHRRRVKYKKILSLQPVPTMDQIGPRVLLEYGSCDITLLANWMLWRKWIYDIDNRSAQETGYLFEPLLASCLGGEPVGAKNSPVKRLDSEGKPTSKGRQIDCLVPSNNMKLIENKALTICCTRTNFPLHLKFAGDARH